MHKMVINQFPSVLAFWGKMEESTFHFPSSSLSLTRLISSIVSHPSPPSAPLRNNKEKEGDKKSVSLGLTGRAVKVADRVTG